jgi:hypothetical protein
MACRRLREVSQFDQIRPVLFNVNWRYAPKWRLRHIANLFEMIMLMKFVQKPMNNGGQDNAGNGDDEKTTENGVAALEQLFPPAARML